MEINFRPCVFSISAIPPGPSFTAFKRIQITSIIQTSRELRGNKKPIHKAEIQINKAMYKQSLHALITPFKRQ